MTAVPEVYVVVRPYGFDKDEHIAAYLVRDPADKHRDLLNSIEDPDESEHGGYEVCTVPLRHAPPEEP